MKKGLFISIEGIDGAGKTTIANLLERKLKDLTDAKQIEYNDVIYTREPGGTNNKFCEQIRNIILDNKDISLKTQILLFSASRIHHSLETIIPNINNNNIVIVDRFVDSSIAYQSVDPNLNVRNKQLENEIKEINMWAIDGFLPDITFLLDVNPITASNRIYERNEANWIDKNPLEYFETIRNVYLSIAEENKDRVRIIDAYKSPERIVDEIMQHLKKEYEISK